MKLKLHIDPEKDEEIIIYAHKKSPLTDAIEQLVAENGVEIIGYNESESVRLNLNEICCFSVIGEKVFARTLTTDYRVRFRLCQLEEKLPDSFVKINQSCLANIKMIDRFDSSVSGTLIVRFRNGSSDYVSRRQMKKVKERIGI
ncbi:MAG: LytTR family transcriptional regulator [Clostridia bacterium]|nr:LytTR family transcriptional regulator [Clostridia bacterium]